MNIAQLFSEYASTLVKMDSEEEIIAAIAGTAAIISCAQFLHNEKRKKRQKRRWWMISLNRNRLRYTGPNLLEDLLEDSKKFTNFCRISRSDFEYLLNKIGPEIVKKDTNMRKSISVQERLAVTLRFLATGDNYRSLSYLFKFSPQVISTIIPEVCCALNNLLKDSIKLPKNSEDWIKIATDYENLWNFPHCLGALDGKHILIQAPFNSGSEFYNYKNTFSIVLMALVDAHYRFIFADIGCQGRISDGGVFRNTILYQKINENELAFPPNKPLTGRELPVPYVFIADDAFPLTTRILKPFPGNYPKDSRERVYNYRLCRARRIVENAFGIMASVFRILRTPMRLQPDKVSMVVMTCVLLHNFLKRNETSNHIYSPSGTINLEDEERGNLGSWRQDVTNTFTRRPTTEAQNIRKEFAEYFINSGKIVWQEKYC